MVKRLNSEYPNMNFAFDVPMFRNSECTSGSAGQSIYDAFVDVANQQKLRVVSNDDFNSVNVRMFINPQKDAWSIAVKTEHVSKSLEIGSFDYSIHLTDSGKVNSKCNKSDGTNSNYGRKTHSSGLTLQLELGESKQVWCEGDTTSWQSMQIWKQTFEFFRY